MTSLAVELLKIIAAETGRPLNVEALRQVLRAAVGIYTQDGEVETALEELLRDGRIEIVHSIRLGPRYRIMRNRPGLDMSEPETAA